LLEGSFKSGESPLLKFIIGKNMASKIEIEVESAVKELIEGLGYELIEVDYSKKHDGMNLTLVIYSENGISINDCERAHKAVDGVLDELDSTNGVKYILSVSSPGLDRPIKTPADFRRNLNKDVTVKFYAPFNGAKEITGKLTGYTEENFEIETGGEILKIDLSLAAKIELKLDF